MVIIYHRRALPLGKGIRWAGKFGAVSRFYGRSVMSEPVTKHKSIATMDREFMNYVHNNKLRHFQLVHSYSFRSYSAKRLLVDTAVFRRQRFRKIQTAFKAYFQYEIKQSLMAQAGLVNLHGQAAVNRALGEPVSVHERDRLIHAVERRARAVPVVPQVKRHIATMGQLVADRFDMKVRMLGGMSRT